MRLLAPQSTQQSPERCLHLDVLLFNVLDAEDAPVHHVLVVVQQRVGLQCNGECVTLLCVYWRAKVQCRSHLPRN
jgi:hypothetical protein